jgi:hypothetical protein
VNVVIHGRTDGVMNKRKDIQVSGQIDTDEWIRRSTDRQMTAQVDRQIHKSWTDLRTDRQMDKVLD